VYVKNVCTYRIYHLLYVYGMYCVYKYVCMYVFWKAAATRERSERWTVAVTDEESVCACAGREL
jgi:hypothetical protein